AAKAAQAPLSRVRRVVLGTPGLVDPATGEISFAWDLPHWHDGLLAALRADLGRPVVFENDVNLAAIAEAHSGAAQDVSDFVLVFDPALVVLAGDVGRAGGAALADRVHQEVAAIVPVSPNVVPTGVPADPVLHGALLTGLEAVREEVFGSTLNDG